MLIRIIILLLIATSVSGCAKTKYAWNGYDDRLYSYYKTPAESDRFMEALKETIQEAEAENRVPPGIYAEYGYMLYERRKFPDSALWFAKERDKWPESRFFMERMINLANGGGRAKKPDEPSASPAGVKGP